MDHHHAITDTELQDMERQMLEAFEQRSIDGLNTLGFGEIGVPVAWPANEPHLCVKRIVSAKSAAPLTSLLDGVRSYIAALEPHVDVVPTDLRTIVNGHGMTVAYLVQPLLPRDHLLENVLEATTPVVDHPAVVAVRDVVTASIPERIATIDSQLSNFTWHDGQLAFFDVGTPFMLDADGKAIPLDGAVMAPMPALLRGVATREAAKIANEFADVRGNLEHAAISVARLGLDDWIDPVVQTFNPVLDDPLDAAEIREALAKRHKDMANLKNLMKLQRAWATKVRRQPYDFFITDSFSGEIL